ncbi:hypothetical protein SNEBB_005102 [Seison nebaliae]|nr:hypothetical protein SNEBB_005102 [Seison nebaliae]
MFLKKLITIGSLQLSKRSFVSAANKCTALRQMLKGKDLDYLMEAHNGMSAKIVEEAGFKGIWGSGLSISAQYGVRDSNEISWTQVTDMLAFMSEVTDIPILVDADTGYGNFNNARRLVKKLEQIGVAGACIEDKLFPKTNSLLDGRAQPLADMEEFCGKIKAMKDTQRSPDFSVVARVEAFIAGWPLEEVLKRSDAYYRAGADAILMHSKRKDSQEIELFMKNWDTTKCPVVIVPTNYYETPTQSFREWNVSTVIWANHNIRASVNAMKKITDIIQKEKSLVNVQQYCVPVKEIFRLQDDTELKEAEKKYLP